MSYLLFIPSPPVGRPPFSYAPVNITGLKIPIKEFLPFAIWCTESLLPGIPLPPLFLFHLDVPHRVPAQHLFPPETQPSAVALRPPNTLCMSPCLDLQCGLEWLTVDTPSLALSSAGEGQSHLCCSAARTGPSVLWGWMHASWIKTMGESHENSLVSSRWPLRDRLSYHCEVKSANSSENLSAGSCGDGSSTTCLSCWKGVPHES